MSTRVFQNVVSQMKNIVDKEIGIIDSNGFIIACSDEAKKGDKIESIPYLRGGSEVVSHDEYLFKAVGNDIKANNFVYVKGQDELSEKCCLMMALSLANIKKYYDEKYDKSNFIKNVILDNILLGDICIKAKELHFIPDTNRVVFLVRTYEGNGLHVYDTIKSLFPSKNKDFVISIDEQNVVLVKELEKDYEFKEIENTSKIIVDTINTELLIKACVGIGTVVNNIKGLARSYQESQVALEVGKVFDTEKFIISYDNLGIARLIYQLPTTLCELFLKEVFKKKPIDALDHETIITIQKFFENNLNVSETSRQLYIHRNTLVYRLDKIQKLTGLDLRTFDHAIVFKVSMMVKKYLKSNTRMI